jgi:hypothetical protein
MPYHAIHPMQDYLWKDFYMHDKFDMQPIRTSMLVKFYSCKKPMLPPCLTQTYPDQSRLVWVIQFNPARVIHTSLALIRPSLGYPVTWLCLSRTGSAPIRTSAGMPNLYRLNSKRFRHPNGNFSVREYKITSLSSSAFIAAIAVPPNFAN